MKNFGFTAALFGFLFGGCGAAMAAYPVNQAYQATNAQGQMVYLPGNSMPVQNGGMVPQNTVVIPNSANAVSPTRVTVA